MRFPEFTGAYLQTTIDKLTTKVGSGVTPKGGDSVYTTEGHPFVRSQNVGYGHMLLKDIAYIDDQTHQKQLSTEIKEGDVLLNITGASIGRSCVASNNVIGGNVNQHVCIIRPNEKVLSDYLCCLLLSDKGQKQIDSFQAGGNRQGLNYEQIKSFRFSIPTIQEQAKVSSLLSLINERIATQSRAIEKLQSLMKGMVVAHYQQSKKQEVKIADIGRPFPVMNLSKEQLTCDGIPCVLYGELFTTYHCVIKEAFSRTTTIDNATLSTSRDLLFPASTTVDALSLIAPSAITKDNIVLGGDMFGIHINDGFDNVYLAYLFNYVNKKNLARYCQGSTIIHLHYGDIYNVKIMVPNIVEQRKIVQVLDCLQSKIECEKELLNNHLQMKNYLLQHMFI